MRPEQPGGADDEAAPHYQRSRSLAPELRAAVGIDRVGVIGLAIGPARPVEDVVGRDVEHLGSDLLRGARHESGALRVDQRGVFL